jgi:lauroyl/myristoyl acyltransferase
MNIQDLLNSRLGIGLGFLLSRLPPAIGYRAADWIADRVSSRKELPGVQAVRANQWVVHNQKVSPDELDYLVRNTYRNTAYALFDFWHYLSKKDSIKRMVDFDPSFFRCVQQAKEKGEGLLFVVPHFAGFDLVSHAAILNGVYLHVLSYPQPPGAYRWQNKLREQKGLKITPISMEALRMASDTLRAGGIVCTGIDRPLQGEEGKYRVYFFGRQAVLPVFFIRLAMKHDVPVVVIGGCRKPDRKYLVWASEPILMKRMDDLVQETVHNAEILLEISARDIRQSPDTWAMFYPVWPDVLGQVPD